jgi:hypothetical protein
MRDAAKSCYTTTPQVCLPSTAVGRYDGRRRCGLERNLFSISQFDFAKAFLWEATESAAQTDYNGRAVCAGACRWITTWFVFGIGEFGASHRGMSGLALCRGCGGRPIRGLLGMKRVCVLPVSCWMAEKTVSLCSMPTLATIKLSRRWGNRVSDAYCGWGLGVTWRAWPTLSAERPRAWRVWR